MTDFQPGQVCHYGTSRLAATDGDGGSKLMEYVKRIVGYSGPILYVGVFTPQPTIDFEYTRMWTHSISWMNILFSDLEFLDEDGVTDGGCFMEEIRAKGSSECPNGNADKLCYALLFGLTTAVLVAILVPIVLVVSYFCHCCCFKKHPEHGTTHFERVRTKTMVPGAKIAADA